ncbi:MULTISPECIES: HoxN/HupN/NixA family nickel/cobalt transporter [Acidocella]|uniref:HoxN/HupN/NixA family nickel/cobalt transporter n=1 Tax=Acidocella TaxID=50709 RepID=UPI00028D0909|nr:MULTISPECIES: HoxN/HupN/NixA family nickel/cobalt transporter [Acidocella]EKM98304.1 high-affinity nickel-transporter [Acidocella sp. MX-AZ02]WBO59358.1 HoxN/HupN/NixA family nickel/cobalt transporter [Acidocella sp. MX-AZ03]
MLSLRAPGAGLRAKVIGIYLFLFAFNIGAWLWALLSFRHHPVLLGTALLAYIFGLRHAVDADHIAAIDNVTRKLMQQGQRPVGVGFFFSIGHSAVLLIGVVVIAAMTVTLADSFNNYNEIAGTIGTLVSTLFLLLIALMNLLIAFAVYRSFRHVQRGGAYVEEDFDLLLNKRGLLARLFQPLFRLVSRSWHMLALGVLFGLGFDTATEVTLLGIASTQALHGMSLWPLLTFPLLFAAGMSLIDTTDGILMLGAYGWAFVKPVRKLYYNLTITLVSALVALVIGGIEGLGLIASEFALGGWFWDHVSALNDQFGAIGYIIIGIFILSWVVSTLVYKFKRYDELEITAAQP